MGHMFSGKEPLGQGCLGWTTPSGLRIDPSHPPAPNIVAPDAPFSHPIAINGTVYNATIAKPVLFHLQDPFQAGATYSALVNPSSSCTHQHLQPFMLHLQLVFVDSSNGDSVWIGVNNPWYKKDITTPSGSTYFTINCVAQRYYLVTSEGDLSVKNHFEFPYKDRDHKTPDAPPIISNQCSDEASKYMVLLESGSVKISSDKETMKITSKQSCIGDVHMTTAKNPKFVWPDSSENKGVVVVIVLCSVAAVLLAIVAAYLAWRWKSKIRASSTASISNNARIAVLDNEM